MANVTTQIEGDIAVITMDDGKANAINLGMLDEIENALATAEQSAKAVVFTGRPGKFCAGFDLKALAAGEGLDLVTAGGKMVRRLFSYPLPLVAAANGHGIALGGFFLLACDTRIGAEGPFKIGLNETAIGMVLPPFGLIMGEARIPTAKRTEAVLQARFYDPVGAVEAGYLDEVQPEAEVQTRAKEVAGLLATLPGETYAANKLNLRAKYIEALDASFKSAS